MTHPSQDLRYMGFEDGWQACPLWSKWLPYSNDDRIHVEEYAMGEFEPIDLASKDLVAERIEQLKQLFPEIVTERGLEERERE